MLQYDGLEMHNRLDVLKVGIGRKKVSKSGSWENGWRSLREAFIECDGLLICLMFRQAVG